MDNYAKIAIDFAGEPIDPTELAHLAEEFSFNGFDPNSIMKLIIERGGATWKEDAKVMIVIGVTRGNKIKKMMDRMSEEGRAKLKQLVDKYKLKESSPGAKDLTLSRIAAVLAPWTVQALRVLETKLPVTGATMDSLSQNYPRALMHSAAGGLLDPTLDESCFTALLQAHSLYLDCFSRLINPPLRSKTKQEVAQSFSSALQAAYSSNFFSSGQKRQILQHMGLIDGNMKPMKAVIDAAGIYAAM
ncbi:nucleocapsid [Odrenisrou virus]|uniref:Nucleoprotein n=1 Tax=Odrenisrou virus TaxID=1048855 RepID=I1T354_9VIRU|nr:nucleocapsid [Odrenisrou virus]AEL29671.1 nucleocapsid [Odrenisrou virus]